MRTALLQENSEIAQLEKQCEETLSKARAEAASMLEKAKSESTKEQSEKMAQAKAVRLLAAFVLLLYGQLVM